MDAHSSLSPQFGSSGDDAISSGEKEDLDSGEGKESENESNRNSEPWKSDSVAVAVESSQLPLNDTYYATILAICPSFAMLMVLQYILADRDSQRRSSESPNLQPWNSN